jgi:hypothetical protein
MPATQYGVAGAIFGTIDQTDYFISNIAETGSIEEAELTDGDGDIVAAAYHGKKSEISCDFTVRAASYPTTSLLGATITILGDTKFAATYIVTGVTNTKTKADWMTGSFTARRHLPSDLALVTTTTTTT